MMDDKAVELGLKVVHFGVNCASGEEALKVAELFAHLFGLKIQDGNDSVYAGPMVELMKNSGRGTCGHIAIGTSDIFAAQKYLEKLGCKFASDSAKYNSDDRLVVIYLDQEIAGFAVHLLQL